MYKEDNQCRQGRKKKKGKKGKIAIKVFDNMNRSFRITNFMIVGIWWKLYKNYFVGKPLREASQILGNLRLLGKSKQSYRAISSVLCFWRENGLWRRGLQVSQVDFFPPSSVPLGTYVVWRERCQHSLPEEGVEAFHLPCPPGHLCGHHITVSPVGPPRQRTGTAVHGWASPALMEVGQDWPLLSPLFCLPPEGTEAQDLGSPHPQETPKGAIQAKPGVSLQLQVQVLVVPASPSIFGFPLRYACSVVPCAHITFPNCCTHEAHKPR